MSLRMHFDFVARCYTNKLALPENGLLDFGLLDVKHLVVLISQQV